MTTWKHLHNVAINDSSKPYVCDFCKNVQLSKEPHQNGQENFILQNFNPTEVKPRVKNVRISFWRHMMTLVVVVSSYLRTVTESSQLTCCIPRRGPLIYMHQPVIQSIRPTPARDPRPTPHPRSPHPYTISPCTRSHRTAVLLGKPRLAPDMRTWLLRLEYGFYIIWPY